MCRSNRTLWAGGLAIVMGASLLLLTGCGGGAGYEGEERAAVSGTVSFDGKPLPYGTVTFVAIGAGRRASGMIQDGKYSIPEAQGPNLGKYRVEIIGHAKAPVQAPEPAEGGEGGEEGEDEERSPDLGPQIIPDKYQGPGSELQEEIVSGENPINFTLTP